MIFFFLAQDRATGMLVDDGFGADRYEVYEGSDGVLRRDYNLATEHRMQRFCDSWRLDLIDYDGPVVTMLWRMGLRGPKWANQRPHNIPAEKWDKRFRSTNELSAFRAGLKSGEKK